MKRRNLNCSPSRLQPKAESFIPTDWRRNMTQQNEQIELKDSERQKCEVWTRVMGYHRPLQSFNIGKKWEFE